MATVATVVTVATVATTVVISKVVLVPDSYRVWRCTGPASFAPLRRGIFLSSLLISARTAEPQVNVRFSNRPFGVKHFQTVRRCSVDVTHGLVLLFGIGTKALVWGFFSQEV